MIEAVADDNNFFELQAEFAANIVTGYIRLNGKTIGVVANQRWCWQEHWTSMPL